MSRVGPGPFGALLRGHAARNGVATGAMLAAPEPVSLAVVELQDDGSAGYRSTPWAPRTGSGRWPSCSSTCRSRPASCTSARSPAGRTRLDALADLVGRTRAAGGALVSFDPNVRASLVTDEAAVRARIDGLRRTADVVKVSAEDLAWLEPGADLDEVAVRWAGRGAGAGGPHRRRRPAAAPGPAGRCCASSHPGRRSPTRSAPGDTPGRRAVRRAGAHRHAHPRRRWTRCPTSDLVALLDDAALVAALACTRPGADPPTAAELAAARG